MIVAACGAVPGFGAARAQDAQPGQQPKAQVPAPLPPAVSPRDSAMRLYYNALDTIKSVETLPCLDKASRDAVINAVTRAIAALGSLAQTTGDSFLKSDPPDSKLEEASVLATGYADKLQRALGFVERLPICMVPLPPPPPKGGPPITEGWPEGVTPPSRTEIPDCLTPWAEEKIAELEKKIPEEEHKISDLKDELKKLRAQIEQLVQDEANAKRTGQNFDAIEAQIQDAVAHYNGLAFQLRSVEIQHQLDLEDYIALRALKPCKQQTGYIVPPGGGEQYAVSYVTDSTTFCTFTAANVMTSFLTSFVDTPATDGSPAAAPAGSIPGATPAAGRPDTTPRASTPPAAPPPSSKPDTPTTPPDKTVEITPQAPDDTPSEIPDDVEIKAKQQVLEGGGDGQPIDGQVIKLAVSTKPELPAAPSATGTVTRADTGFDQPPVQCVSDAGGGCTMKVPPTERAHYGLPDLPKGKQGHYRLAIARPQTSGGVAELTGRKDKLDPHALESLGSKVAMTMFRIGSRSFARFAYETRYGLDETLPDKVKEAVGPSYHGDICREKEKYPDIPRDAIAAAAAARSVGDGLPAARLSLRRIAARHAGGGR